MSIEVNLTTRGLSGLKFCKDFELKTDDKNDTIMCSRYQISFISPIVSKLLQNDPTINEFALKTLKSSQCSEILRSLLNGSPVVVRKEQKNIFRFISHELGNEELLSFVDEDLSLENVVETLRNKQKLMLGVEREVEFIASNLYSFKSHDLSSLDISIIESILSHESLHVLNEHQLFSLIQDYVDTCGDEYRVLFSHLRLEYLDHEDISIFINKIDEENIGHFLSCIYDCILSLKPIPTTDPDKKRFVKCAEFQKSKLDGIFAQLSRESGGNVFTNGLIGIEFASKCRDYRHHNLIDQVKQIKTYCTCLFCSEQCASIIFDFKDMKFSLNGYSLKSFAEQQQIHEEFTKSWKIEGSNDKETWTIVDERKSGFFESFLAEGHWPCEQSEFFRFFRVKINKENKNGDLNVVHALEFYGSLLNWRNS